MVYTGQYVYLLVSVCFRVELVDSTPVPSSSYLKVEIVHRDIDVSIISSTSSAISLAQCFYRCARQSSPSLYYVEEDQMCHCNSGLDTNEDENPDGTPGVVHGYPYPLYEVVRYKDCLELYEASFTEDGVYPIHPVGQTAVDVWCDMVNGGWTVFQRRLDGSEDFYRGWSDYVSGFGNKTGEYWLGLDNLHALTSKPSEMNIIMETFGDVPPTFATNNYSTFSVDGPSMNYRLHWDGFTRSCGVHNYTLDMANGMNFSTFDNDNDLYMDGNCADLYKGAWWHNRCWDYNLNGLYLSGYNDGEVGISYRSCWGLFYSLKKTIMKLRRLAT